MDAIAPERHRIGVLLTLLLAALLAAATPVSAAQDEEILIEADSGSADRKTGTYIYRGNVRIRQGSVEILAEEAEVHLGDSGVTRVSLRGAPATFTQGSGADRTQGRANRMEYEADADTIELFEDAWVVQDGSEVSGPRLSYDIVAQRALVEGDGGDDRVSITIQPRRQDDDRPADTEPGSGDQEAATEDPDDAEEPPPGEDGR